MKMTEVDEPGLFLLGIELLDSAGQTLFETLERQLKPLFGEDWFSISCVRNPGDRELAPRDLSVLLVQIEIRNNNNFRLAIRTEYNNGKSHDKKYFERLTDLRITRNEWFHRIISPITTEELFDLCNTIIDVFPPNTQIAIKAKILHDLLESDDFIPADLLRTSKYVGAYVSKLEKIEEARITDIALEELMIELQIEEQATQMEEIMKEEIGIGLTLSPFVPSIGDPYTGSLLPQKYTLKLDGTIIDRREGIELKAKLGDKAISIGHSILKNHPNGGRLRLSAEGTVVGYVDEDWVVIGFIDINNWFDT